MATTVLVNEALLFVSSIRLQKLVTSFIFYWFHFEYEGIKCTKIKMAIPSLFFFIFVFSRVQLVDLFS